MSLHKWHHDIHQVTGEMAKKWTEASRSLFMKWAIQLRTIADEMDAKPKTKPKMKTRGKK